TGKSLGTFVAPAANIGTSAISPDGARIATIYVDRGARAAITPPTLWNATTGEIIATLPGHHSQVTAVEFSPDGTLLATSSYDGIARLWNGITGEAIE